MALLITGSIRVDKLPKEKFIKSKAFIKLRKPSGGAVPVNPNIRNFAGFKLELMR